MLTSIHIKNFRSCKDVKLDGLGLMLGLVGRNAAGKTTILEAIRRTAATALADKNFTPSARAGAEHIEVSLEATVAGRCYRYTLRTGPVGQEELVIRGEDESSWARLFTRRGQELEAAGRRVIISHEVAAMTALAALLPPEDAINQTVAPLREVLARVHYYPGHDQEGGETRPQIEPSKPIASEEFERWAADEETRRSEPSVLMRLLYAHERERERFDELKSLMNTLDLLQDISVSELRDQTGRLLYKDVIFRSAELGRERSLSFFQLSGGTRRVLYLLAGLLFDESSVMLIEQPEDGIHPALLFKLIHLLRVNADPTQIFFSSHSPTVLSNLKPQHVRLVAMKDGATQVRALTEGQVERAEEYMRRDGSLAEYLELIQED